MLPYCSDPVWRGTEWRGTVCHTSNMVDIHKFIRNLLKEIKIDERCIFGIMAMLQAPSQVVRMKFGDDHETEFKKFLQKYEGNGSMVLGRGRARVKIYDASLALKYVRVGDAPFELPITSVIGALRGYGAVMDARRDRYVGGDYLAGYQGWVTVQMVMTKDIPSYLDIGEYRVIIKYQGQKFTCRGCGRSGHIAKECPDLNDNLYDKEKETEPERIEEMRIIEEKKKKEIEEARKEAEEEEKRRREINFPEEVQEPAIQQDEGSEETNEEEEIGDEEICEQGETNDGNEKRNDEITVIEETQLEKEPEKADEMSLYYYNKNGIDKQSRNEEILAQRKLERKLSKNKLSQQGEDRSPVKEKRSYSDVARSSSSDDEDKVSGATTIDISEESQGESNDEGQGLKSPVLPAAKSMSRKNKYRAAAEGK